MGPGGARKPMPLGRQPYFLLGSGIPISTGQSAPARNLCRNKRATRGQQKTTTAFPETRYFLKFSAHKVKQWFPALAAQWIPTWGALNKDTRFLPPRNSDLILAWGITLASYFLVSPEEFYFFFLMGKKWEADTSQTILLFSQS